VSVADVPRDIAEAGTGMVRLIRYDPRWVEAFDASAGGFLRSFAGPLISLPFVILIAAMVTGIPGDGHVIDPRLLWAAGLSQIVCTVAFPVVVGLLVRPLGIGEGYGAFIVVVNWASLFVNIAITAATALLLFGTFDLFGFVWLVLFGVSLFVVWRASRETLSHEIAPALMMVVLWVGVNVGADRLSQIALGLPLGG
jgi:hypothetical protein